MVVLVSFDFMENVSAVQPRCDTSNGVTLTCCYFKMKPWVCWSGESETFSGANGRGEASNLWVPYPVQREIKQNLFVYGSFSVEKARLFEPCIVLILKPVISVSFSFEVQVLLNGENCSNHPRPSSTYAHNYKLEVFNH